MADTRYNIVFSGELVPGADLSAVKQNLARVFRMDADRVEALFTGKAVVLKKDADQATAMKFRAVMKQAGARCRMEPVGDLEEIVPAPPPPAGPKPGAEARRHAPPAAPASVSPVPASPSAGGDMEDGDMEMVGTIRTGGTGFAGAFGVAPVGADLADRKEGPAPLVPDVSGISLAPAGADMGQAKRDAPVRVPDVSHLSVAPPGTRLSDEKG